MIEIVPCKGVFEVKLLITICVFFAGFMLFSLANIISEYYDKKDGKGDFLFAVGVSTFLTILWWCLK